MTINYIFINVNQRKNVNFFKRSSQIYTQISHVLTLKILILFFVTYCKAQNIVYCIQVFATYLQIK